MVLLLYVDGCLLFITSKYKIDKVNASIQAYFKIEDDGELKKYLRIELDFHQRILNMIPGMDKSSSKPTPAVKPPLEKNYGDTRGR